MKYIYVFILCFVFLIEAHSQHNSQKSQQRTAVIKGTVLDDVTDQPIEFATVGLKSLESDLILTGTITGEDGKFILEQLPSGQFTIVITFIGYRELETDTISINEKNQLIDIGTIRLLSSTIEYSEFTITGEKKLLETSIDKKVFNVGKNISSEGGSAVEVLEKVPAVEVDINGNISLRGSSNVTVLIDGRPSGLTGSSRQAVLEQIPASSIESIEIITNPSAKYDPEGMVGIINVVLKKDKRTGTNGNVSVSIGTKDQYNFNFGINSRSTHMNVFANYSYRKSNRTYSGDTYRELHYRIDTSDILEQISRGAYSRDGHMIKAGSDFYLNEKNTIGISLTQNLSESNRNNTNRYYEYSRPQSDQDRRHRYASESDEEKSTDMNLYYQKWFSSRKENLMIDFNLSTNTEDDLGVYNEYIVDQYGLSSDTIPELQNNFEKEDYLVGSLKIDYVKPFKENRKLEMGYDGRYRLIDNDFRSETFSYDFNEFINDVHLNNNFIYTEEIHALYTTYSDRILGLDFQAGLRAEQAFTTSELKTDGSEYENDYFSLFPTLHITREMQNNQDLQFSYSRRINRPRVRNLNPFTDYDDPLNLRIGNPYLKPEYINSFEVSHYKEWNKTQLISSAYYKKVYDVIRRYKTVDTNGVSTTTFSNLANAMSYGLEFILISNLTKWWNINANLNLYRNKTDATNLESELNSDSYAWFTKLNSTMNFKYNIQLQLSGHYRSPMVFPQGEMKAMYFMDLAIKKSFLDRKASITLRFSDPLKTRKFEFISEGSNFYQESLRQRDSQLIYLVLSYRFGKPIRDMNRKRNNRDQMNGNMEDFDID